jgi:DeoR/GlpR family transcriptional regulator of sugar metabolism
MARAMQHRAGELGLELRVAAPTSGIAREIRSLRSRIAQAAIRRVDPGDTILINAGVMAKPLADAIADLKDVTVVTNAFGVLEHLSGRSGLKVIMTSGEYHARERCLVGPSLGALFETIRVDKAFLSVDGLSVRFGASAGDERLALAARRFADASREVFVLADHSLLGAEANHRIVPMRQLTELITDSGSLPADRLACTAAGLRVTLADLEAEPSAGKGPAAAGRLPAEGRK